MSAYFNRIELDMIALEAAIGAYEVDNGLTDDVLDRCYEDCAVATESIDDDFGFGLFGDIEPARATEGVGSAIGGGIKKILNAIAGFFKKVGEGIASFFNSFKKKKAEVSDKEVKLTPEATKVATNIRSAIKTALDAVGNISKKDTEYIKGVINNINNAIKEAKVNAQQIERSYMDGASDKQKNERAQKLSAMASKFESTATAEGKGTDDEKSAAASEMLTNCENYLAKVKATQEQLTAAVQKCQDIFQDEVNKLNLSGSKAAEFNTEAPKASVQRGKDDDDDRELQAYNQRAMKRSSVGVSTATDKKDMAIKSITNQIKQYIFVTFDFETVKKLCKDVGDACHGNAKMCTQIANNTPEGSRNGTAYRMCKVLSDASNIYTAISTAIEKLVSGTIFSATKDGHSIKGEVSVQKYDDSKYDNIASSLKDE